MSILPAASFFPCTLPPCAKASRAASLFCPAGAAATTAAGTDAAAAQGRKRSAAACQQRYAQLAAAAAAAGALPAADGKENLEALLASLRARLQRLLAPPGSGPKALAAVQSVLAREAAAGARMQRAALAAQLQQHLMTLLPGAPAPAAAPQPPQLALQQAQALTAAVRRRCGDGAARAITSRLQLILGAGEQGEELLCGCTYLHNIFMLLP